MEDEAGAPPQKPNPSEQGAPAASPSPPPLPLSSSSPPRRKPSQGVCGDGKDRPDTKGEEVGSEGSERRESPDHTESGNNTGESPQGSQDDDDDDTGEVEDEVEEQGRREDQDAYAASMAGAVELMSEEEVEHEKLQAGHLAAQGNDEVFAFINALGSEMGGEFMAGGEFRDVNGQVLVAAGKGATPPSATAAAETAAAPHDISVHTSAESAETTAAQDTRRPEEDEVSGH
mmetsp:Transcript_8683/g.14725  ORF Transcript_8683/g.14725 Transcript_8683/m.14725 type:complete len:231 (+) Transcript_8683:467-1159(+)